MSALETGDEIAQIELHSLHLRDGLHIPEQLLSEAERQRAAAFRSMEARRLFVAGRVLCRGIVGTIAGCAPQALSIAITPAGRPYLPDHPEIDFNLSHTRNTVALAICRGGHVGVDIERLDAFSEAEAREIMSLILSGRELDDIHQLAFEQRHMTFLSYWVRKEAALKCLGDGFLTDPQHVILGADDTIIDIKSQSSAKPTSIWSGQFRDEETIRFQWATAVSQTTTEPIWQHHADLNSFMKFL